MAYRGCKQCVQTPEIKCQKCKKHFCKAHLAVFGWNVASPYRLCKECHLDFLGWLKETGYSRNALGLCCMINPVDRCVYCKMKTCELHKHVIKDCMSWQRWKPVAREQRSLCCFNSKAPRADYCRRCSYPSCGEHKDDTKQSNRSVCQLCGELQ